MSGAAQGVEDVKAGGKPALAKALAGIERAPDAPETIALLSAAWAAPTAHVIGLTGPPGVGKSSLTNRLIPRWRAQGLRVGVIAVDPSSKRSGGALLGDRIRLATDPDDDGVFVRSMAARDRLGGLAALTVSTMVLMRALFDVVLIETVGVGQSETDILGVADTVVFCVQPGSGDSLQFMKSGIMEIPHILVITKADMGMPATQAETDAKTALALGAVEAGGWSVPVLMVSAKSGEGVEALSAQLDERWGWLCGGERLESARLAQAADWLEGAIRERFGQDGVRRAKARLALSQGDSPFEREAELLRTLSS